MPKRERPQPKKLEEHEPGATRDEVFQALEKTALYRGHAEGKQMTSPQIKQARPARPKSTKVFTRQHTPDTPARSATIHISTANKRQGGQTWTSTLHSSATTLKSVSE